jgi:hypothetical protein
MTRAMLVWLMDFAPAIALFGAALIVMLRRKRDL